MDTREVELIDYLRVIWRWKWLIVGGVAAAMVTVFLVAPRRPASFTVETIFEIGPWDVQAKYLQRLQRLFPRTTTTGNAVTVESLLPGAIKVSVTGDSESAAQSGLEAIASDADAELARIAEPDRKRIAAVVERRDQLLAAIDQLRESQLNNIRRDGGLNSVLVLMVASERLSTMEAQLAKLDTELGLWVEPTLRRGLIQVRPQPAASPRLLLTVASLAALTAFTALAFLADYLRLANRSSAGAPAVR